MSGNSCEITSILKDNLVSKVENIKKRFYNANIKIGQHNHIHKRANDWQKHQISDVSSTGLVKEAKLEKELKAIEQQHMADMSDNILTKKNKNAEEIFLLLTKHHGRAITQEFVSSGKKKVSMRDFIRAVDDLRMNNVTMDDIAKCWPIFDMDGDGDLSLDEFSYVLANWRHILRRHFSHDQAREKADKSIRQFEDTLVTKYYNAPEPPRPTVCTVRPQSSPNKRRKLQVGHLHKVNFSRSVNSRALPDNLGEDNYIDGKIDLTKLYLNNVFDGSQNHPVDRNGQQCDRSNPQGMNKTYRAIKAAIDFIKSKRSMAHKGIDLDMINRGKKFSKLYNFTKYDRRFLSKMKMLMVSEIVLTPGNFLSVIFNSFSVHDLLHVKDIKEPLLVLLSKLPDSQSATTNRQPKRNTHYFVDKFQRFSDALQRVIVKHGFDDKLIDNSLGASEVLELSVRSTSDIGDVSGDDGGSFTSLKRVNRGKQHRRA